MTMRPFTRYAAPAAIGLTSVLLAACGGSGSGLIPTADAGPLERDFEETARLAMSGNGSCGQTTEAIERTERDFAKISASVDATLRARLQEGISNLRRQALAQCAHVTTSSSSTTSRSTPTSETVATPTTTTASSSTTSASATTSAPPRNEEPSAGGTRAPGEGGEEGGTEAGGGGAPGNEAGPGSPGGGAAGEIGNHRRGR